jgi:hypothetical protein
MTSIIVLPKTMANGNSKMSCIIFFGWRFVIVLPKTMANGNSKMSCIVFFGWRFVIKHCETTWG